MPRLTIHLFGYPQIQVDHDPVRVERRKTLALAAYLAVEAFPPHRGVAHPGVGRETLSALLWPDATPDQAGAALRQALWDFGKSAGEHWLARNTRFVSLNPQADIWVDVARVRKPVYPMENRRDGKRPRPRLLPPSNSSPPSTRPISWPASACATARSLTNGPPSRPNGCASASSRLSPAWSACIYSRATPLLPPPTPPAGRPSTRLTKTPAGLPCRPWPSAAAAARPCSSTKPLKKPSPASWTSGPNLKPSIFTSRSAAATWLLMKVIRCQRSAMS